jgi:phosphatidylglycerophosphate synthase
MEEKKTEYNKWKSRRWLIVLWAMILITFIVGFSIIKNNSDWVAFATTLVAVPVAFTSLETLNKKHKIQELKTQEELK